MSNPTAAAIRAAKEIYANYDIERFDECEEDLAIFIDRETALPELIVVCKTAACTLQSYADGNPKPELALETIDFIIAALEKAGGTK